MFCSLKEAAERLRVSEGEIEAMLRRGALHEFREGPSRLVKASEVGALAQSLAASPRPSVGLADDPPPATGVWASESDMSDSGPVPERETLRLGLRDDREGVHNATYRVGGPQMRLPHCAAATLKAPVPSPARPRNTGQTQPQKILDRDVRRNRATFSGRAYGRTGRPARRIDLQTQEQSVRQWFWNGLIQDRPVTIAILFGLVLLVLSALLAGVCILGPLVVGGHAP